MTGLLLLALLTGNPEGLRDGSTQECQEAIARGRERYERRAYGEAASIFEAAVLRCDATEPLLLALAQAQLLAQRVDPSLETLERLLALNPRSVEALKVKGRALYLAARDAEAERTLKAAIALEPADEGIAYDLGRIYYQQKRHAEAAGQFRRAIALNPTSHKAYDNLALATEALGDIPQALRYYLKAIELVHTDHPQYGVVYANLADLMLELGEYRKAFDLAAEAAERDPDDARHLFLTGKALVKLERHEVSLRWLERSIALDPTYPEPRYLLARTYQRLGRATDADREFNAFKQAQARASSQRR